MTRRDRLRRIRDDLAATLESGELAEIAWMLVTSLEGHVRSLLEAANGVERADSE
jgi:hypothetical protein